MAVEPLHTLAETAKILGISTKTLMHHVRYGRIEYVLVGTGAKRVARRFTDAMIQAFLDKREEGGTDGS